MSPEEFRLLRDLIREHCGIHVRDEMQFVMERRLRPRLESLGLGDFTAYHRHLKYASHRQTELDNAVEALTTHETYFFREPLQLESFSEELLPALYEKNVEQRALRIWSAGCSTGEEAYTVAMLLADSGRFSGWDVQVYGTDISQRVISQALQGEYGPHAIRSTPAVALERHFEPVGQRFRVKPSIQEHVSFGQLNLLDVPKTQRLPRMDVIFCRNVLIYFDVPSKRHVVASFFERLVPGGYLLLGHSESLLSLTADFELVHLHKDLVYRKPEAAP
jgi:chemotaxis protein methyltransferase CheR